MLPLTSLLTHAPLQAADLGASQLLRFCLQAMVHEYDELRASGTLRGLRTELCGSLFLMRTDAPIQDALAADRADVAEWLLDGSHEAQSYLSATDQSGRTALEVALGCADMASAKMLLSKGALVNAMIGGGNAPLIHMLCFAAGTGSDAKKAADAVQKITMLIDHGASVDSTNGRGESALDVAFFNGGSAVVGLLLSHGASSAMTTPDGGGLLHAAVLARRADVLGAALSCHVDIGVALDQPDMLGRTPLHLGVSSGELDLVTPLLRMRATKIGRASCRERV